MWASLKRADNDRLQRELRDLGKENASLYAELSRMQQRFGSLGRSVWWVQEEERRRIARDLHDSVGQTLTALCHRLEGTAGDGPGQAESLTLCRQALEDVRELSRLLRPPVLDDLGLAPALAWLGRRLREHQQIRVDVKASNAIGRLSPEIETLVFRITQEALNNVAKHSGADRATVQLTRVGTRLELRISDDGRGFDPQQIETREDRGVGLAGMKDRVSLFGGDMLVTSTPRQGTRILVSLTLPDHEEQT